MDKFFKSDIRDMYEKAGGKSALIDIYYRLPGLGKDKGLRKLEGDKDCLEMELMMTTINTGVNDVSENEINLGDLGEGVYDESETENNNKKTKNNVGDLAETENYTGDQVEGLNDEGENENNFRGFSDEVHEEHDNTIHEHGVKDDGVNGRSNPTYEGNLEDEPQSDSFEDSDCPSWILEDLEGPSDDDIFDDELYSLPGSDEEDLVYKECMHKVYRAKRYALELVKGETKEQYNQLYNYCENCDEAQSHQHIDTLGGYKWQELKKLFWKAASTYNVRQHLRTMREIERISPKRGSEVTAYECYILEAGDLPIIDRFVAIRRKCMSRIQVKMAGMKKYNGVVWINKLGLNTDDYVDDFLKKDNKSLQLYGEPCVWYA
ncbi:hypothetical protein BUALT_Bualt05G0093100 [Buddleja alternifolia]|uniref:Uncharacterized protein n=1 Tax=Buddleja alternifolia TaxID=168488 RepID=A0AAV6XPN2_9LAMI|nr:hypothetical protein BUALT_Bualt05G0093100 [Buddleja alternifolia]